MRSKAIQRSTTLLYDRDFVAWTFETARLIRSGLCSDVDLDHVAEEIEDMGRSATRELLSRLTVLLIHLLKWKCSAARPRGWHDTIAEQRDQLDGLFRDSPSLRRMLGSLISEAYRKAVRRASIQTGMPADSFPRQCPFTERQVLDVDFLPDDSTSG